MTTTMVLSTSNFSSQDSGLHQFNFQIMKYQYSTLALFQLAQEYIKDPSDAPVKEITFTLKPLALLLSGITDKNRHDEYDFGAPVGHEEW